MTRSMECQPGEKSQTLPMSFGRYWVSLKIHSLALARLWHYERMARKRLWMAIVIVIAAVWGYLVLQVEILPRVIFR